MQAAKTPEAAKALQQYQKMAVRCFRAAVEKQPSNVPAIIGCAAVQAIRGDLALAARILAGVSPHAWPTPLCPSPSHGRRGIGIGSNMQQGVLGTGCELTQAKAPDTWAHCNHVRSSACCVSAGWQEHVGVISLWVRVQVQEAAPEGADKWHGRLDLATNTANIMLGQNRLRDAVQLYASSSARCAHTHTVAAVTLGTVRLGHASCALCRLSRARLSHPAHAALTKGAGLASMSATGTAGLPVRVSAAHGGSAQGHSRVCRFCRNTDAQLLLYQARCLHHERNHAGAQRLLLQALHLDPSSKLLRFNIALEVQVGRSGNSTHAASHLGTGRA